MSFWSEIIHGTLCHDGFSSTRFRWSWTGSWTVPPNKTTADVHDYLDERTGVLAAMLGKRAPGYTGLGFSDPRRLAPTPSASTDG